MEQSAGLKEELARARRLAAQSYDPHVAKLLADYAEELERRIASTEIAPSRFKRI